MHQLRNPDRPRTGRPGPTTSRVAMGLVRQKAQVVGVRRQMNMTKRQRAAENPTCRTSPAHWSAFSSCRTTARCSSYAAVQRVRYPREPNRNRSMLVSR